MSKGGRRVGRITSNGVKAKNGLTDMSPLQDSVGRHEARRPMRGVNIVKIHRADGTTDVKKVVVK